MAETIGSTLMCSTWEVKKWRCWKGHEFMAPSPTMTLFQDGQSWTTNPLCWECMRDFCNEEFETSEVVE